MSSLAYKIYLILTLGVTASKCLPQKECTLKTNTLIVEGSIKVSSAAECQAKCQQDRDCKFFTYNKASKGCGLRKFVPQSRSFSLGNISGLKNESPLIWNNTCNSVYVAKSFKTETATACQAICLTDNNCKAMIFNKLSGQCSLNYGEGPYREIPLGSQSQFGISSCLKKSGMETGVCATVYDEHNYRGSSRQVKIGENTPNAGTIKWNQKISSLRVESGCQFTGYDFSNYRRGGWNPKTWTSNVADLSSPYNNDISSWKCTCGEKQVDSILITGGQSFSGTQYYAQSEVLLTDDCTLPDLPKPVYGNTLVTAVGISGKKEILSCGGILNNTNQRTTTKDCYAFSINGNGDSEWTRYNSFTEDLSSSGWSIGPKSVFLQKYGTFIFGSGKSQFLPIGSNEWQRGPTKNEAGVLDFNGICAVAINDEDILIMGANFYPHILSRRVYKFNVITKKAIRMPDLKIGRGGDHDCALFKGGSKGDYVLVTGGSAWTGGSRKESYSKTTEIYYLESGQSEMVGDMKEGREQLRLIAVESPKPTIFAFGGIGRGYRALDTVEEWDDLSRTWKSTTLKLKRENRYPASLGVARDMICPM